MENPIEEPIFPTMKMRRFANQRIVSAEIALKIAQMIVIEDCGEAVFNAQQPMTVSSDGDFWHVIGLRSEQLKALAQRSPNSVGALNMRISQFDGQITELHYEPLSGL
jgi:hypothetical protein